MTGVASSTRPALPSVETAAGGLAAWLAPPHGLTAPLSSPSLAPSYCAAGCHHLTCTEYLQVKWQLVLNHVTVLFI